MLGYDVYPLKRSRPSARRVLRQIRFRSCCTDVGYPHLQLRHPLQPSSGAAAAFEHLLTDNERILGPDHLETLATQRQGQHWRTQASDPSDVNSTSTSSERRARWPGGPQLPPRA